MGYRWPANRRRRLRWYDRSTHDQQLRVSRLGRHDAAGSFGWYRSDLVAVDMASARTLARCKSAQRFTVGWSCRYLTQATTIGKFSEFRNLLVLFVNLLLLFLSLAGLAATPAGPDTLVV